MIAIVNVDNDIRLTGEHTYELRINQRVICTFKHNREEPLHELLLKGAIACENTYIPNRRSGDMLKYTPPRYDEVYRKGIEAFERMARAGSFGDSRRYKRRFEG